MICDTASNPGEPPEPVTGEHGSHDEFVGASLLRGRSPREVLARIVQGDPLELAARAAERVERRCWIVDGTRLRYRAAARVAHAAMRYRGDPPLDRWLQERIDQSIAELIAEDSNDERSGLPPPDDAVAHYALVSNRFGVELATARRFCVVFNSLDDAIRLAIYAIYVKGQSIRRHVAEGHGPPEQVKARLRAGLGAMRSAGLGELFRERGGDG